MEGAEFNFNAMNFNNMNGFGTGFGQSAGQIADESIFAMKPVEGDTSTGYFFEGDEGIDTTSFGSVFTTPHTEAGDYTMQQNLTMDNTMGGASTWNSHSALSLSPATRLDDFSHIPNTSFDSLSMYQPLHSKRPLQLDVQDFPQSKRHESVAEYANPTFSPFLQSASVTGSSWTMDTQPTPSSVNDIGLSDEAADVCATWFSKYAVLPSDRHIESLSQLTGESHNAIRHWFGQMLKQGMAGHDSAYKSQTSLSLQDQFLGDADTSFQTIASEIPCDHDTTQTAASPPAPRGGRKGCKPTTRPDLLSRDPNKIYQCTRKCGKRYGRKCDWKRNEEEGYPSKSWVCSLCIDQGMEKVKPCFRKYHFSQHFRNIHPGLNSADYEATSVVHSDTSFPRRCGFCPHRFKSRQDRIDHIADHFKKGKCMLDWNDDDDDNAESDNMDDDDDNDRPDSDGFDGQSDDQQDKDTYGGQGPKQNGSGSNGPGGPRVPSGFGQFQLNQLKNSIPNDQQSDVDSQSESCNKQINVATDGLRDGTEQEYQFSLRQQSSSQQQPVLQEQPVLQNQTVLHQQQRSITAHSSSEEQHFERSYSRHDTTERIHKESVARDAIPKGVISITDQTQIAKTGPDDWPLIPTAPSLPPDLGGIVSLQKTTQFPPKGVDVTISAVPATLAEQCGGPVSSHESHVLPITDAMVSAGCKQPNGKLDVGSNLVPEFQAGNRLNVGSDSLGSQPDRELNVGSCLLAESQPEIPRDRLRLLTLEGGGIRDSTLHILLEHLMGQFNNEDELRGGRARLRDFFDAIGGPSTGGLFATMLGRIGMEPAAIFDLVGEMSRASKEQVIAKTDTPSDFAMQPPLPPSPQPSELRGCAYISNRTSTGRASAAKKGRKVHSCECGRSYTRVEHLRRHQKNHTQGSLVCEFPACGKIFFRPDLLQRHQERHDGSGMNPTTEPQHDILQLDQVQDVCCSDARPEKCSNVCGVVASDSEDVYRDPGPSDGSANAGTSNGRKNPTGRLEYSPTLIEPYAFVSMKLLGTGGFSTVDEVFHRETNLRVSRKTLKNRDPSAMEELRKEVTVLQKLRHPHIIRFLGAYSKCGKMSILLSPVAETNLAVWLERSLVERPHGLRDTVVKMFGCLVSSIRYLHEQRPVVKHMDIKPQNILVMVGNQEFPHIVLSDFGVSSSEEIFPDHQPQPLTRQYCAPEIPSGIARDQAADIWSLGCVLVEMAATAFSQDNSQWLDFRKEFGRSEGKYYWQDVPRLQEWLSGFQQEASTLMEKTVLLAAMSMLNSEPAERPDAVQLTMVFTPAPCCLDWANDKASFPGPVEELDMVEMLVREDGVDCRAQLHQCSSTHDKQVSEPSNRARNWLDECFHDHEACRHQEDPGFLPTRLVDLQPQGFEDHSETAVRIVNSADIESSDPPTIYATISHSWGSSSGLTLTQTNLQSMQIALPRDQVPRVVSDAMMTAKNMGFRYVWVDSLCILQDSQTDLKHELPAMASVYRNAAVTIAAHGTSPTYATDPGLTTPTPFADNIRAWSLQERLLSRRLLHLAGEQMYWECNSLKASETFPRGLPSLIWEKVHTKTLSSPTPSTMSTPSQATPSPYPSNPVSDSTRPSRSTTTLTTRRTHPRLLRDCQYLRLQGGAIGDSMTAQSKTSRRIVAAKANTGRKEEFLRKDKFQAGRWRYNESRQPIDAKFGAGISTAYRDKIGGDDEFKFEFDFEIPVPISVSEQEGAKVCVKDEGMDIGMDIFHKEDTNTAANVEEKGTDMKMRG